MDLPEALLALLRQPSPCFLATTMPDGSPQLTQTWGDTDGRHVLIDTVEGYQKTRNVHRDPRVAVNVCDPANPFRYYEVRGRVVRPPPTARPSTSMFWLSAISAPATPGTAADEVRVILAISAQKIHSKD